jgi:hypothetical protein
MKYCADCGTPHECLNETREVDKTAIELKRLETHRDIEVARLTAGADKHIADVQAEHSAEHAEGLAEGMETALDAISGNDGAEGGEGEPVIIGGGDPEAEPEPEPAADLEPPVVEVPEPSASRGGYWDSYR